MRLFALFAACIVIGLSGGEDVKVFYGKSHTFHLSSRAEYLYFKSDAYPQSSEVALWTRSNPSATIRGQFESFRSFTIDKLTQADNGRYTIRSKMNNTMDTYRVNVSHHEMHFSKNEGEQLLSDFPMELKSYTVTFTSPDGETALIHKGYERQNLFDGRLTFRTSRRLTHLHIDDLQARDSGVFNIRDDTHNLVMRVTLEVAAPASAWLNAGFAAGAISLVASCCFCLKRSCCTKSSKSTEEVAESPDDPPTLQEYSVMPPPPSYHREPTPPSVSGGPVYSYRPADPAPSSVETYSPPPAPYTAPPAETYSSGPSTAPPAMAPATESQAGTQDNSFGSNFLSSETDPCFEKKGMDLAPPLYSECVSASVYTSDKLNFL